ncbi:uncharacterized protein [Paramormyrops kingsleyae]|uniref:uncharacterized protein isoform X2 n=1 Tax=Paramormyrops kingsleyae TaxID=1676925 RepID=UPI003B96FAF6
MEKQSHFTFHVILTGMSPEKSPEDCWAVLRAAKNDFLAVLGKVYPEEMPLECAECCLVLYYLEATVILKHLQPPGVVEHMTVQEWMTRSTSEADHTVIVVKEHKTSAQQVATFALSSEEETWFHIYFTQVRPQLLSSKRSQTTSDDLGGDERFFVSTAGRPVFNASNDLTRLHQKYKLDPVTYQTARRIFETATKDLTDQEKSLVADYLTHSTATADEHYRMKQSRNVVLASKLLKKLAGDSSADSAEEGPSCSARGAARDAALASNQQMDVQAAFDQLLRTHPVTLDGDVPEESRERDRKKRRAERQKETDEEPALKKTASMADEAPISFTSDLYIQRLEERAHEVQQKPKQDCSVLTGYITKNYNVRQHLEAICTGMLESPWETEKAQKPMVHFEDDEQMDEVFAFLSGIVKNTAEARQLTDEISFILDVLLPEATIHALAGVHSLCEEAARQMYLRGPQYDWRLQRTPSRITQLSQTRNAHTFYGTSNASLYDWPKSSPPGTPTGYIKVSAACTV